jgi:hypothetical protein
MAVTEVEVWVVVDECGNALVAGDEDTLTEQINDNDLGLCRRIVKMTIKVPTPEPIEVDVDAPAGESDAVSVAIG